jgi:hypothetical protein
MPVVGPLPPMVVAQSLHPVAIEAPVVAVVAPLSAQSDLAA